MVNGNKILMTLQKQLLKTSEEILKIEQFSCPIHTLLLILFLPRKKKSENYSFKKGNKHSGEMILWFAT